MRDNNSTSYQQNKQSSLTSKCRAQKTVPGLDKERPYAIPIVRPLPIPHLHNWGEMEVCLINFNKDEDDEGCLKFCIILKRNTIVSVKLLKGCLKITVRYDSMSVKV